MYTDEMSVEEARLAVQWMTERVRKKSGDGSLNFPSEWIPETGMAAFGDDGRVLAVATLYLERSSPVAVCGWCFANPENRPRESWRAVRLLMSVLPAYARRFGAKFLMTTFGNRGINRILDSRGFVHGENSENKFIVL